MKMFPMTMIYSESATITRKELQKMCSLSPRTIDLLIAGGVLQVGEDYLDTVSEVNEVLAGQVTLLVGEPTLILDTFTLDGVLREFIQPYFVTVEYYDDAVCGEIPGLGLYEEGSTIEELRHSFDDALGFLWREYVEEAESLLDQSAIELRARLRRNVR